MKSKLNIKNKLIVIFLVVAIVPSFFVLISIFSVSGKSLTENAQGDLLHTLQGKEAQLLEFLNMKQERTKDFASDGFIRDEVERLAEISDVTFEEGQKLNDHLRLNKKPIDSDILSIHAFDLAGRILAVAKEEPQEIGDYRDDRPYFVNGKDETYFQNLLIYERLGTPSITIGTPLFSRLDKKKIGVLMNRFEMNDIQAILSGERAESIGGIHSHKDVIDDSRLYLVSSSDIYVDAEGVITDPDLFEPKIRKDLVENCFGDTKEAVAEWGNTDGTSMLGAVSCIRIEGDDWAWAIVLEKEKSLVLAPLLSFTRKLFGIGILFLPLLILTAILFASKFSKPLIQLTKSAKSIAAGKLHTKIHQGEGKDEISTLSVAIKQMTNSLISSLKNERGQKNKIESLIANMGDGVISTDNKGVVVSINRQALKMFGLSEKHIGKPLVSFMKYKNDDDKIIDLDRSPVSLVLKNNKEVKASLNYIGHKSKELKVSIIASPIVLDKKTEGVIITYRDITKEAEIDRAKSEFVSLASHQLRTPLTSIRWILEKALEKKKMLSKWQKSFLPDALGSTKRMIGLVDDLLNVSRLEAGVLNVESVKTDIEVYLEGIIKEAKALAKERKQTIQFQKPKSKIIVHLDPQLIAQVIGNLLSNAIHYSDANTVIELGVEKEKDFIKIFVKDQGIGISKEDQAKLFTKFFRSSEASKRSTTGSGLGLYVINKILSVCNGKIKIDSKPKKGTTFTVILPIKGPFIQKDKPAS